MTPILILTRVITRSNDYQSSWLARFWVRLRLKVVTPSWIFLAKKIGFISLYIPSLVPRPVRAIRVTRQVTSHLKSPRTTGNEAGISPFQNNTDLKCRWTATSRTVTLAAAAWGGTTLTRREKQTLSFSRGDGRRIFFNFISREWVPWKRSERFWSTFIWWCHIRWGIRSIVQWNLVELFVTRKRMFVASFEPICDYVLPHFPTLHSS